MTGITSYGAYIPLTRLPFSVMAGKPPKDGGPEKAVAWADEDSITMAVTAAMNCLQGVDRSSIDLVILATTTYAFAEKQGASIVAKALDLCGDVRTVDISGSLRSGTLALQQAMDAVKAGSARQALVVAADCRMGAPRSGIEMNVGDAAAAFVIGNDKVLASLNTVASCAKEMMDIWRKQGDDFVHTWEDRFINEHGYIDNTVKAVRLLLEKSGKAASDFSKACLYGPDARSHGTVVKQLGLDAGQVQHPFFGKVGNAGCANVPLQLVAALESATKGDSLLLASYGDGADALAFDVSAVAADAAVRRGVAYYLERRRVVDHYGKYLTARDLTIKEYPPIDDQGISATVQYRHRDENFSLQGQVCACGTHQFPKGRVCVRCGQKDQWTPVTYANASGEVVTYTFDAFFPSPEPPTVVTITEVKLADGSAGPRIHMQFADASAKDMEVGKQVEFVFRRIHQVGKRPNYFWKCIPLDNAAVKGDAA
ncbi:MAG: hypothetical protein KDI30_05830 [Pseudomonadales bacterium]|nr:hypothetical protein [Pseudomonadales bacterium]